MTSEVARHLVSLGRPLTPPSAAQHCLLPQGPTPKTPAPRFPRSQRNFLSAGLGARSPVTAAASPGGDCEPRPSSAATAHSPGPPRAPAAGWSDAGGEEGFSFSCGKAGDAGLGSPSPREAGPGRSPT